MDMSVAAADGLAADLAYQVTVLVRARAVLVRTRGLIAPNLHGDADADWSAADEADDDTGPDAAPGVM